MFPFKSMGLFRASGVELQTPEHSYVNSHHWNTWDLGCWVFLSYKTLRCDLGLRWYTFPVEHGLYLCSHAPIQALWMKLREAGRVRSLNYASSPNARLKLLTYQLLWTTTIKGQGLYRVGDYMKTWILQKIINFSRDHSDAMYPNTFKIKNYL